MISLIPLIIGVGIVAGILAGLLGIGGGLVIVPILLSVAPEGITIHHIVATSLACILPTAISSVNSHRRRGNLDLKEAKRWVPPVAFGAFGGSILAHFMSTTLLEYIFAILCLAAAFNMFRARPYHFGEQLPSAWWFAPLIGVVIGILASWMGVGGGMFIVPLMVGFAWPLRKATAMGSLLAIFVAIPSVLGYVLLGGGYSDGFLGYVYLPYFAIIVAASIPAAPLGVYLGTVLPVAFVRRLFAAILFTNAVRILFFS
ncbi:MAG: sulfite exporter TauE/SafE family protein [Alphaproteobacteria bacterium]|nr:sulfite exporter TauE/SafE family protein [Alphaproteobacteria bacterium]